MCTAYETPRPLRARCSPRKTTLPESGNISRPFKLPAPGKEDVINSDTGRKRSRLIQVICEEWLEAQEYPGTLDSEVVYERLISEGEHFAEGEMDALLTHLRDKEQIIHGPVLFDREMRAKHGAMTITSIADWLC